MKKLMMIGLMAITPFIATPIHSVSSEAATLVLAEAGYAGSMIATRRQDIAHPVYGGALMAMSVANAIELIDLANQTSSLLIRGTSRAILGYTLFAVSAHCLTDNSFPFNSSIGGFMCRSIVSICAIIGGLDAIRGTNDIINNCTKTTVHSTTSS